MDEILGLRSSRGNGSGADCVILNIQSNHMEQLYRKTEQPARPLRASRETVKFLLDYSKSLSVVTSRGITFERNLN